MQTEAYAKINLTLDINGRDECGYHLLSSVFSEISLSDTVSLEPGGRGITLECNRSDLPLDGSNLCCKAARIFLEEIGRHENFRIGLIKRIPDCAGLGGGSSDAAAVIRLLCSYFDLSPDLPEVRRAAVRVGADVPFFLIGKTCLAEGVGEKLTSLPPVAGYTAVVAKTAERASTPQIYQAYDCLSALQTPRTADFVTALRHGKSVAPFVSNHLTVAAAEFCPSVLRLKNAFAAAGAEASEMSGSGSAVYGLFSDKSAAIKARNSVDAEFCEVCRFV